MFFSGLIIVTFLVITGWLARRNLVWAISWLLFMLPAYLVRISFFGIPTTALELGIYLIFIWWVSKIWLGNKRIAWQNYYWLAVLWILAGLVSVAISPDKIDSLGLWKGWIVDPILLMIVVSQIIKKPDEIKILFRGLEFLLLMLGMTGLIQIIFGVIGTPDGRLAVFWDSPNYLAMILVPSLIMITAYLIKNKSSWWERVSRLFGLSALVLSASFVGIGSLVLGLAMLGWIWWGKEIKKFMLGLLVVVVIIGGFIIWQSGSERFARMTDLTQRSSVSVRLEVWRIGWEIVRQNPVWGIGLGNFEEKYIQIAPDVFHPPTEWRMLHAHNFYLHTWIELTLFGLVVLLAIILSWWFQLGRLMPERNYWVAGIMAVLLAWAVGGLLDTPYYKNDLSVIFWILFGLTLAGLEIEGSKKLIIKN